jgi:hypothetical protein
MGALRWADPRMDRDGDDLVGKLLSQWEAHVWLDKLTQCGLTVEG